MSEIALPMTASRCSSCSTELAATLLVCPACHALVHRERLESLAREAEQFAAAKEYEPSIAKWRETLALLPASSRQYDVVAQKIDALTAAMHGTTVEKMRKGPPAGTAWAKVLAPLGIAGLLIWKFKFIFVVIATKGKLLLVGLTKVTTLGSMFVSLGVYWTAWGWKLAAAVLAGIYVHEMGHVAQLRRRGMTASAPMFVPGIGAFVRMHEHAATPAEDARIGLAGPVWGLGAALAAYAAALATGSKFWLAAAHVTAIINLFNLTPVWQLDGSRGFHALTRPQRWIALAVIAAAFAITREGMLLVIGLVAGWRAFERNSRTAHDWGALATYAALVAAFSTLAAFADPV